MTSLAGGVERVPRVVPTFAATRPDSLRGLAVTRENVVDYDIHGMIGIRLENPAPTDVQTFEQHLRERLYVRRWRILQANAEHKSEEHTSELQSPENHV